MRDQVTQWLTEGRVDVFLGYRMVDGHPLPHCFSRANLDEVTGLIVGQAHYALEKIATRLAARQPDLKIGLLLARTCNQRAVNVLTVWNQLAADRIVTLDASENNETAGPPETPAEERPFKQANGPDHGLGTAEVARMPHDERFARWMYEFSKCIKCYGCRNICPVCFCKECSLEHKELVGTGSLPPEIPIFHLVRAAHMAGRCIDCGLCEEACPTGIPLRLLYRKVNEIVTELFDYDTGASLEQSPFSLVGEGPVLSTTPM